MKPYDFKSIEKKWQKIWQETDRFKAREHSTSEKYYCLEMFPYPSGRIHMGHVRNYVIGDVMARFHRLHGREVIHPIGWDAFGLPAENAAIKNNTEPEIWTRQNIAEMKSNLQEIGVGYDWDREFATCDTAYYRWNQWLFLKFYEKGLAYRKESRVNWCPQCRTVLANEQVSAERTCWRCESEVGEKYLNQWFLKITEYAEELLESHHDLEGKWPPEVLLMQKNWIGKSYGAEVDFKLPDNKKITVFTTRPDTLFGATFMVLAPEHPLAAELVKGKPVEHEVAELIQELKKVDSSERISEHSEKKGVSLGITCTNPVNGEQIPVWTANYVLMEYGTGAIMAVPAHDQRDYEFAKKYNIPVREVIRGEGPSLIETCAYAGAGSMINSGEFTGYSTEAGGKKITEWLKTKGAGDFKVHYRIRDWLISRQRYWGTPIPVIHCKSCGIVPVSEKDLPVELPAHIKLTGKGKSPLENAKNFINVPCPKCSKPAKREADTLDTFVDSSWYFLRFCDSKNTAKPCDRNIVDSWMPVDLYIGGIEHACMHLIYARFFHKFMRDIGLVSCKEPFSRLLSQGMVTLGGTAMSKSKGNIVESSLVVNKYGADTGRLYILFASPPEKKLEWSDAGIEGSSRFLNRVWRLVFSVQEKSSAPVRSDQERKLLRTIHKTIKRVTIDIEQRYQLNTAIAALMELVNELNTFGNTASPAFIEGVKTLIILLYPFAPHMCEELWIEVLKEKPLQGNCWPNVQESCLADDTTEVVIQVNGRLRSKISIPAGEHEDIIKKMAVDDPKIKEWIGGKKIIKTIYIPKQLINLVVK
ncbi:MAG: leucine--tRNA ligase [bacterium]